MALGISNSTCAQSDLELIHQFLKTDHKGYGHRVSAKYATWADWQKGENAQVPNFDSLPSIFGLPDPMRMHGLPDGTPIATAEDWEKQKQWIKEGFQQWIYGTMPPAPSEVKAKVLEEHTELSGTVVRMVELSFDKKATIRVELMIPLIEGPKPVFMTQWNHRAWAQIAVRRGYIGCVYAGADARDDTDNFEEVYPDYDFSKIMQRAFAAHRAVDYLYTLADVDTQRIAVGGHSRNGKQSMMAGLFDERIDAVVTSSAGTIGENPMRYSAQLYNSESLEYISHKFPHWMHPRMRFFVGREHKLPIDMNLALAGMAPRFVLLSTAETESQGNPWGIEQALSSAQTAYDFLKKPENIQLYYRGGEHGTSARDIEVYIDHLDRAFGRSAYLPPVKRFYPPMPNVEATTAPALLDIDKKTTFADAKAQVRSNLHWLMGEAPPSVTNPGPSSFNQLKWFTEDDYITNHLKSNRFRPQDSVEQRVIKPYHSFGDYLFARVFFHQRYHRTKKPMPTVIFMHGYSYPTGYHYRASRFIQMLVEQGYAVVAFDQIGFGTRIAESERFYERYPAWSKLGKMVADTRALVTAVETVDFLDGEQIYLAGYGIGGMISLATATLDDRVKGIAVSSALAHWRDSQGTSLGVSHLTLHGLAPRAKAFETSPEHLPIDTDELLMAIGDRPTLVIAPQYDYTIPAADAKTLVQSTEARWKKWRMPNTLSFEQPVDYGRFHNAQMEKRMVEWLIEQKK